jgi:hypothetical protein
MGLLRNASELIIPDAFGGKPGRGNDPEFHISRLNHFGQGMGVDLSSTHPLFSRKHIARSPDGARDLFSVNSHDEGLQFSVGHLTASGDSMMEHEDSEPRNNSLDHIIDMDEALFELQHRGPFKVRADTYPVGGIHGSIMKEISDGGFHTSTSEPWGSHGPQSFKDADKLIRTEFANRNRNRTAPSTRQLEMVNRSIAHPNEESLRNTSRKNPFELGPQFLSVRHWQRDWENDEVAKDHIDLKTGTWAKIDPEGYFPD